MKDERTQSLDDIGYNGIRMDCYMMRKNGKWIMTVMMPLWIQAEVELSLESGSMFIRDRENPRTNGIPFSQEVRGD